VSPRRRLGPGWEHGLGERHLAGILQWQEDGTKVSCNELEVDTTGSSRMVRF
jgi:hypothetical protein